MQIKSISCEFLDNPIGIQSKTPRLSWILESKEERGKFQQSYQIIVATSKESLIKNECDLWDSGKIESDQTVHITYDGTELQSRMQCYWKVKVWDENNAESEWSEINHWVMGIFPQDWNAKWIGAHEIIPFKDRFPITEELGDCPKWCLKMAYKEHPDASDIQNKFANAVHLRKEFTKSNSIKSARIRIAGLGFYEIYLNGEKVGDSVLDPGATDYTKTILYASYDVTKEIQEENCVGVILGNGWYNVGTPDLFEFEKAEWNAPPKCRVELELTYQDDTSQTILTDETWKLTENGPIRFNCIRSGELYDARQELKNWNVFGGIDAQDSNWTSSVLVPAPKGILHSQLCPPIKVYESFGSIKRVLLENEKMVYWFPKNNAGWVEIKVRGEEGQKILIELSESLNPDGSADMEKHGGHTYGRNQTLEYICKGNGVEIWHPQFCYAGFQYAQITGATPDQILEVTAKLVCTSFKQTGTFNCSNLLINTINENSKRTFLAGYHSYPEDCPQREKTGWTEDALISSFGSVFNFDTLHAYEKWIQDLIDAQHKET